VGLCACGDGRPPPPPPPDGSGRDGGDLDAAPADGGGPGRSDAGPILPPADVEVVLPYLGPEHVERFEVNAQPAELDVLFSIDTTGSFGEEIDAIQADLDAIIEAIARRVEETSYGVSRFEDFPEPPWGGDDDRPFELVTRITSDRGRVGSAMASLDRPLGNGGDAPESGAEALYQIATGDGYRSGGRTIVAGLTGDPPSGGGDVGGAGFRESALRVVVHVTDAPTHGPADYEPSFPGTRSLDDAIDALRDIEARVVGIASGEPARPHLDRLALDTGATIAPVAGQCPTGIDGAPRAPIAGVCPLVFDIDQDGTGLSDAIVDGLVGLVETVRYGEVWGEARDDRLRFVRAIAAVEAEPPAGVAPPGLADLRPADDGIADTFTDVRSGTRLLLEARLRNETIPPADYDQVFRVTIEVLGDGLVLDRRTVRIIVPRGRLAPDAGLPDAGSPDAGPADASSD
jgi:hypothetical protein